MQITKNIFISFVMAGSSKNSIFEPWELETNHPPQYGRNWWFWVPSLSTNGGRFKADENTDINLRWLCYSISLTAFSGWRK